MTLPDAHEITQIGDGFLACTLPATSFGHREHLIMAIYLRYTHPDWDLAEDLPDLIRRFNVSHGGVNDDDHGYHHTITLAYLDLIEQILRENPDSDVEQACAAVLTSPAGSEDVLFRYWTRETLFSREARRDWVEPDLAPWPFGSEHSETR